MAQINWDEFKAFKAHSHKEDNFEILLDFMKSYYNMIHAGDMYDMLVNDPLGQMMLEKRDISDAEGLENHLYR